MKLERAITKKELEILQTYGQICSTDKQIPELRGQYYKLLFKKKVDADLKIVVNLKRYRLTQEEDSFYTQYYTLQDVKGIIDKRTNV